jgi:hypothetical protein
MSENLKRNLITIGVVVLLLTAIIIYGVLKSKSMVIPEDTIGNTAGNLNNNGLFCEHDGRVYFANSYDSGCIYSMNPDQTDIKKLYDLSVKFINAGGDYVFFYGETSKSSSGLGSIVAKPAMYQLNSNGKNLRTLSKNVTQNMLLVGKYMYYQNYTEKEGTTFHRMDVKKHENEELLDYMVNPSCFYNGKFYYNGLYNNHYLYSYDINTDQESLVYADDMWNPVYDGSYVYFMDMKNNYRLCRYSLSENTMDVLTDDRLDFFNKYGSIIYYQKSSQTEPGLYRINSDGQNKTLIKEGIFNNINITSTYVYFQEFNDSFNTFYVPTYGGTQVYEFTAAKEALKNSLK